MLTLVSALLLLQGCNDDDDNVQPEPEKVSIVAAAKGAGNFTTLVAALEATGQDEVLNDTESGDQFTVFAPTDAAFAALGQATIDSLLADPETLAGILGYHVISGRVNSTAAVGSAGSKITTLAGSEFALSLSGDSLLVNTATVTSTDIETDNGIIHVIDAVLMPPAVSAEPTMNIVETAVAAGNFTTLATALTAADLIDALSDESQSFTVFAPTDAAFALIDEKQLAAIINDTDTLTALLTQHVIAGEVDAVTAYSLNGQNATTLSGADIGINIDTTTDTLQFGGVNVTTTNIKTTNGIIHVIDAVIVADVALPTPAQSIVDVARAAGNFTTLIAALEATGLDQLLDDVNSDFTVFAPSDDAFALLGEDTLNALLADPDTLANILTYHVVSDAKIMSDAAVSVAQSQSPFVTMANSQQTALSFVDSSLYINQSLVSTANVMAFNGIIHVVDQVILPPKAKSASTQNIAEIAVATDNLSTLVDALQAADLVSTLSDESQTFTVFAPTNAAFDKIPDATLSALLADNTALSQVLLQHVIVGAEVSSLNAFAANGTSVNTGANNDVTIDLVNYTQTTNSAADEVAYDAANQRLVGGNGSGQAGFTVYVFDNDLGQAGSVCEGSCATTWPPVLVTDADVSNIPGLSIITRTDGSSQAAFRGRPLYFYAGDTNPGDTNGAGVGNVWWAVSQPQVSLQVQGSAVTTTDIYAENGVIHLIDTVITETLE